MTGKNYSNNLAFALLCVALVLVALTTAGSSDALSTRRKTNAHNNQRVSRDTKIAEAVISSVRPSVVDLTAGANLTVSFSGLYVSCAVCNFNVSAVQNATTNPISSSYYSVVCPFPRNASISQGIVSVWISVCNSSVAATDPFPLYVYSNPPSIESITPEALYATGGYNVTVRIPNPPPTFLNLRVYCNFTEVSQPWLGVQLNNSNLVICPFPVAPIGPATLSIYWSSALYPYTNVISTTPYPVVVRSNRILSIYPTSACVLGGTNITLNMEHPTGNGASCMFSAVNDEGEFETVGVVAAIANGGSYICPALPWGVSSLNAVVSLVYPTYNYPLTNPVALTYFTDCATSIDPFTVCSVSNLPVTVSGQGFPPQGSRYATYLKAAFWLTPQISSYSQYSTVVSANTTTEASFVPSTRLYNYNEYYVQISSTYSYSLNSTSLPLIEMRNTNSCLSSATPSVLNYDGGDLISVKTSMPTFAYTGGASSFYCVFVDPSGVKTFMNTDYVSSTELTCVAPPVTNPGIGTLAIQLSPTTSNIKTDPLHVKWIQSDE